MYPKFGLEQGKNNKRRKKRKRTKKEKQSRNGSIEIKDLYRCYQVGVNAIMGAANIVQTSLSNQFNFLKLSVAVQVIYPNLIHLSFK